MSYSPHVSVIIPTLNNRTYLLETIQSALEQTYAALEIIVIDDGSVVPLADTLRNMPHQVRIIRNETRQGISAARNKGVSIAKGDLVAMLDDDDLWLPSYLEKAVEAFRGNPRPGMVASLMTDIDGKGNIISMQERKGPTGYNSLSDIFHYSWPRPSAVVIDKECYKAIGGFDADIRGYEDADFYFRFAEEFSCYLIAEPLVRYRIHDGNMSHNELVMGLSGIQAWNRLKARKPKTIPIQLIDRRLARQHYRTSRAFAQREEWKDAFWHVKEAISLWPSVGLSYFENDDNTMQKIIKVFKPYFALLGLSLANTPLRFLISSFVKPKLGWNEKLLNLSVGGNR